MTDLCIDLDAVRQAAVRIEGIAHRTPVLTSHSLDEILDAEISFKCENFQKVGAFKFRGAMNTVAQLTEEQLACGVATHSSGNHAAALALAAATRGAVARIVMPDTAPEVKKRAVAGYGAEITFCEHTLESREATLAAVVEQHGCVEVHPFNDPRVIAGQGTAALELLEQAADLEVVMTPVGGGGLLAGSAVVASESPGDVKIWGSEPAGADDAYRSLAHNRILPSIDPQTIADGLLTSLGEHTFAIIRSRAEGIVTVSESAIVQAMRMVWERMKIIIEPSSAVPVAALLEHRHAIPARRIGIVLSGGNVDLARLPWGSPA